MGIDIWAKSEVNGIIDEPSEEIVFHDPYNDSGLFWILDINLSKLIESFERTGMMDKEGYLKSEHIKVFSSLINTKFREYYLRSCKGETEMKLDDPDSDVYFYRLDRFNKRMEECIEKQKKIEFCY